MTAIDEFSDFQPAAAGAPSDSSAADEFAGFASPNDGSNKPPQTLSGGVQAGLSGLTEGAADLAGLPVDTARRAVEIGKAAVGSAYGAATADTTTPANETVSDDGRSTRTTHGMYHYIDPSTGADTFSKNPPPAGSHPFTHTQVSIPSFLQPNTQPDIGSSENIKSGIRSAFGSPAVDVQEQTPINRVVHAAAAGAPSAALIPEAPVLSALSGMAGGAASQTVAESGGGPLAQTLAGLAAGSVPVAGTALGAATRGIVRGGAEGQAAMQARMADASKSNTTLTAGQASDSPGLQYLEGMSSKGWGGGPINASAQRQTGNLQNNVEHIVDNLSGGSSVSPTTAGTAILKGIGNNQTPGTAFGDMRAAEKSAYTYVDTLVPPSHPIDIYETQQHLNDLATPTPGAENTTAALVSPKISAMRDNLTADLANNLGPNGIPLTTVPYSAATALKTRLGNSIDWGFSPADPVTNGNLKQIYSTLKDDIDNGASSAGPQAAAAVKNARALYAKNQETRENLAPIINANGGPENVYQSATNGTKLGATKIGQVMSAINPAQQNTVRATVLDRLGRATPGQQNAEGTAFSANTFLTNWSKMHPDAKDALFGASSSGSGLREDLDSLTRTISNIRSGTKLRNPSGTGEAVGHYAGAAAIFEGLREAMGGNWHTLAAGGSSVAANNILARTLTNPATSRWLAQSTKAPITALPNYMNQLNELAKKDQDASDLRDFLTSTQRPARASGGRVGVDALVGKLIHRWKAAKKQTDATTKPLLKLPDSAVIKALEVAQEHI